MEHNYDVKNESKPFSDFNEWFDNVCNEVDPSMIVGIARGAIRLLQMQDTIKNLGNRTLISNHALPFLDDTYIKPNKVLLFDDSVICGSTINDIRSYLLERGAKVYCASYVIDRSNFLGENKKGSNTEYNKSHFSSIPITYRHKLWPNQIAVHHNHLIRSVIKTPSHYNLDFPTFRYQVGSYTYSDIPYFIQLIKESEVVKRIFDVSPMHSIQNRIYRYTGFLKNLDWIIFKSKNIEFSPYTKLRFTFIPTIGEIHLRPILQLLVRDVANGWKVKFNDKTVDHYWNMLNSPRREDKFYSQSMFRLLTSFLSIFIGEFHNRYIKNSFLNKFGDFNIKLDLDDIHMTTGTKNAELLNEFYINLKKINNLDQILIQNDQSKLNLEEPIDSNLIDIISEYWRKHPKFKPEYPDSIYNALGKIFLTIREVTDSQIIRKINPSIKRLERGLSFDGLLTLLKKETNINYGKTDISIGVDMCVDNGQAVPKILKSENKLLRLFYSGEGEDCQDPKQLEYLIYKGYSEYLAISNSKPFNKFDIHKLCATLKEIFPWLPISTRFKTYGRFTAIGRDFTDINEWLTMSANSPLIFEDIDSRHVLITNPEYRPIVKQSWKSYENRDLLDSFEFIAKAFAKMNDEEKLLISTCNGHRHTYNAIAYEADSWVRDDHENFEEFLFGLSINGNRTIEVSQEGINSLYWCIRYISEAMKKYVIFHEKFGILKDKVRNRFIRQGSASARFFNLMIEKDGLIDDTIDVEIEIRFKVLLPLLRQMLRLTAILVQILKRLNSNFLILLNEKFDREKTYLNDRQFSWLLSDSLLNLTEQYNSEIIGKRLPGKSILWSEIPTDLIMEIEKAGITNLESVIDFGRNCYDNLSDAIKEFCPIYNTVEGDFPYAPYGPKKILLDGSTELFFNYIYILALDIIHSTDSRQTNEYKDMIINIFEQFSDREIYFDTSGNDAYVVVSEDPCVLWDIACRLCLDGEMLKKQGGRFGGTRKAISSGSIRVIIKPDKRVRVMDAEMPHSLPRTFGLLEGIDRHSQENSSEMNSLIAIGEKDNTKLEEILNISQKFKGKVKINAKHITSSCLIYELN